ncbi:hypothetical protein BURKHO8Y_110246 [Burkholderia sp. 8Y]|uniref:RecT family recombinase n=1 Tax=Burkholderia sp. 8Y TaxID=2653133 RepID=UPI0012EFAB9D|nr:RecT family recombinase [Burkholderia sp. 8Y]VXB23807.1 hypothetical protein BURKHO8Y_110246 [Burkholderia sp. 8Y]
MSDQNETALAEYSGSNVPMSTTALMLDTAVMDSVMKFAEMMSSGKSTIPQHLRGNTADCAAVVLQAMQWKMNPYAVAQKTHFVNNQIGYEAQLVNAVITSLAPTRDRIHYGWYGDWTKVIGKFNIRTSDKDGKKSEYRVPGWSMADEDGLGVRVWATLKGEEEPRVLDLLLAQARVRNSPLWADDPRQQLAYLAIKRWARLYTPDVILGVYTPDEFEGQPSMKDITPKATPSEVAAAARPTGQRTERHDVLISELEFVAKEGGQEALAKAWAGGKLANGDSLSAADRKAIGAAELNRLKAMAGAEDVTPNEGGSHE